MELFNVYPGRVEKIKKFLLQYWLLILLTLIGAFLRWYRLPETLQFLGDQGRDALVWRQLVIIHDLPFIGPITSVGGFFLGPFYYYLMAPFYWLFGNSPLGPAYATAFIGILTLPLLYGFTKKLISAPVALMATFLYALAAIPVTETRSAWNPNPMPLASLGLVYGFYQAQKTNKVIWLYFSGVCLGIALQLHYMIVFFGLFILWQLWLAWKNKHLRFGLIGWLGILVLLMSPLILFEIKNHFLNTAGLIQFLTQHRYGQVDIGRNLLNFRGRSEEAIGMLLGFGRQTTLLRTWFTRGFLLGLLWVWFKATKELRLIILWVILTIIATAFYKDNIPPYYLAFIFPAVFILFANLLHCLQGKLIIFRFLLIALFLYFNLPIIWQTINSNGNYLSVKKTSQFIVADINKHNYQNINLTLLDGTKDYKAMAFRYFVEMAGAKPLGIADYPKTQTLYVISPYEQSDILSEPMWEITSMLPATISAQWQFKDSENIYKIERL